MACGRWHLNLFGKRPHLVDAVVAGGVKLYHIIAYATLKVAARSALAASLTVGGTMLAVYGLGEDTRAARLAHATRPAEQICLRKSA